MKPHPVTGKPVPDEEARVEVWRYVKPRAAKWPKADFIVGNPPFIGKVGLRAAIGDGYFEALFATTDVPESADFVMHWWDKAAVAVRKGGMRRFGFVTTNSITQKFSRRVVAKHLETADRISLIFAIANHPWVDEKDGAAVRIAMTVAERGKFDGRLLTVLDEARAPDQIEMTTAFGTISSDLRVGVDVTRVATLRSNDRLSSLGYALYGHGFILTEAEALQLGMGSDPVASRIICDYRNGRDLTARPRGAFVIDAFGYDEEKLKAEAPAIYQHLLLNVKPGRDANRRDSIRQNWWIFGWPRPEIRKALNGLDRFIVTVETMKHRIFQFLPKSIAPDNKLNVIAIQDAYFLGILTSRIHVAWSLAAGGRLGMGDDPVYVKSTCFDPFPFPADVPKPLQGNIRDQAEALDALRKRVLESHQDLTLTRLYNVLEALKEGRPLTEAERDIHDRGLVTLICQHHDTIDALVAEAYGWPANLSDEEVLTRLVALNKERAAEEAKGLIRWLRPEFQAPDYKAPVTQTLDLGETAAVLPENVIPWPGSLPEQVSAVQSILSAAGSPLAPQDVARAFKGKRAATVRPVLDALAGIGMARRLMDGRYAA